MRLSELVNGDALGAAANLEISGLAADSREVRPGFLFAALAGSARDGADFIDDAIRQGAVAVLAAPDTVPRRDRVAVVADPNPRRRLAFLAARFHRHQPEIVAAVTGTNGKTSVASFTRQIWAALGHASASLGTLGVVAPGYHAPLAHTTPDPVTLHRHLADLAARGVQHLAVEASSHGLDQHRLDAVRIRAAGFTNITRDHLDYHPTAEAYLAAKLRLFCAVLPRDGVAVVNADSGAFERIAAGCRDRGQRVISYGRAGQDLTLVQATAHAHGQRLDLALMGRRVEIDLPLAGTFQAGNALCALGLTIACGAEPDAAAAALSALQEVPGRMQLVARTRDGAPVYVDYAHTPDALETVLRALKPHAAGRLVVVFGCGGDRDRGKRPEMGRISAELADRVIVTDDNPRTEDAASIRRAILAACPKGEEIADRARAIGAAVRDLAASDLLVIAGKGHEQGQAVGTVVRPFDDAAVAKQAAARGEGE